MRLRHGSVTPIAASAITRQKRDSGAATVLTALGTIPTRLASANSAKQTRNHGGRGTELFSSETLWVHAVSSSAGASNATRISLVIVAISPVD